MAMLPQESLTKMHETPSTVSCIISRSSEERKATHPVGPLSGMVPKYRRRATTLLALTMMLAAFGTVRARDSTSYHRRRRRLMKLRHDDTGQDDNDGVDATGSTTTSVSIPDDFLTGIASHDRLEIQLDDIGDVLETMTITSVTHTTMEQDDDDVDMVKKGASRSPSTIGFDVREEAKTLVEISSVYGETQDPTTGEIVGTLSLVERHDPIANSTSFVGSLWRYRTLYQIRKNYDVEEDGAEREIVTMTRLEDMPLELEKHFHDDDIEDAENPEAVDEDAENPNASVNVTKTSSNAFAHRQNNLRKLQSSSLDSGDTIDVLVVYTKAAMCDAARKKHWECDPALHKKPIQDVLVNTVIETNTAFSNSQIQAKARIVRTMLDPTGYNETDPNSSHSDWEQTLKWMRGTNDGIFEYIHEERNRVGADFVVLISSHARYCGVGFTPPHPMDTQAFSIVHWQCATGYYSFGHEIAHNIGSFHDRYTEQRLRPDSFLQNAYRYGYRKPGAFRTITSYSCPGGGSQACPRILYFSNPNVKFGNDPTGTALENNARYINEQLRTIANFRKSKVVDDTEQKRKEEEAARLAAEEAARKKAEFEAAQKLAEEEAARKKAEEEAAKKKAEEEEARKAAEEAARIKAEAARKAAEEAARQKQAEAEAEATRQSLVLQGKEKLLTTVDGTIGLSTPAAEGTVFDVQAVQSATVTGFAIRASREAAGAIVEVYRRVLVGGVSGVSTSVWNQSSEWVAMGRFVLKTRDADELTLLEPLAAMTPIGIAAGTTQSFYITFSSSTNHNVYSSSAQPGNIAAQDGYLKVLTGYSNKFRFGGATPGFLFNGMVIYDKGLTAPLANSGNELGDFVFESTFASNNGHAGNIFSIATNTNAVTISAFDIHVFSSSAIRVMIYTIAGDYSGRESGPAGWTEVADTTVTGAGLHNPTHISSSVVRPVEVPPHSTQSFYVWLQVKSIRYTNWDDRHEVSDDNIRIVDSAGKSPDWGPSFKNRLWNGKIYYKAQGAATSVQGDAAKTEESGFLTTSYSGGNGSRGAMFCVTARKAITLRSIWFHTDRTDLVPVEVWVLKERNLSFSNFTDDPSAWAMVARTTVLGAGQGSPTKLPEESFAYYLSAKETTSIYITITDQFGGLRYSPGEEMVDGEHPRLAARSREIMIYDGVGIGAPRFGCAVGPAAFNGALQYTSESVSQSFFNPQTVEGGDGWICETGADCNSGRCAEVGDGVIVGKSPTVSCEPMCNKKFCVADGAIHEEHGSCP